jgi:hypothetical protein
MGSPAGLYKQKVSETWKMPAAKYETSAKSPKKREKRFK